jgi:Ran GTPase-activating protein (RanGAP) involved in mRNA processing and transport
VRECVLRSCKLDDFAMAIIAEALKEVPHTCEAALTHLSLTNNKFLSIGLGMVLEALPTSVCSLNVSGNSIGSQGGATIGRYLRTNTTIRILTMENVDLGPDGLDVIALALRRNKTLTELRLAENGLDAQVSWWRWVAHRMWG